MPIPGFTIAMGVGTAWVVAVEGAGGIVPPLRLACGGPLLSASAHPFSPISVETVDAVGLFMYA